MRAPNWTTPPHFVFFWLLALCGCNEASRSPEDASVFDHDSVSVEQVELSGQVLINHPLLGLPWDMVITDTVLWVADRARDPSLHMFNARTGQLLKSLGRTGDGPGEFRHTPQLQADRFGRGGVWTWDTGHDRMMLFQWDDSLNVPKQTVVLQGLEPPFVSKLAWLTRDQLVGVNFSLTETLVKFDSIGTLVDAFAREIEAPPGTAESEVIEVWADGVVYCPSPMGDRVAIASSRFGRVDFYDPSGQLIKQADAPFASGLPFYEGETGQWKFLIRHLYYLDCAPFGDGLMLLFSGDQPTVQPSGGEWIHYFDWEGNLKRVYHLDRRVNALALSKDGTRLYAPVPSDASIVVYELGAEG